jgi:hypothetical protein
MWHNVNSRRRNVRELDEVFGLRATMNEQCVCAPIKPLQLMVFVSSRNHGFATTHIVSGCNEGKVARGGEPAPDWKRQVVDVAQVHQVGIPIVCMAPEPGGIHHLGREESQFPTNATSMSELPESRPRAIRCDLQPFVGRQAHELRFNIVASLKMPEHLVRILTNPAARKKQVPQGAQFRRGTWMSRTGLGTADFQFGGSAHRDRQALEQKPR